MLAWFLGATSAIKVAVISGAVVIASAAVAIPITVVANSNNNQSQASGTSDSSANQNSGSEANTDGPKSESSTSPKTSRTTTPSPSASKSSAPEPAPAPVAPTVPRALSVTSADADWAALSWSAPSNSGSSAVSFYSIYSSTDGGGSWNYVDSTGPGQRTYTISGLGSSTNYLFAVEATSEAGSSNFSNTASRTTAVFTPSAPQGFFANCGTGGIPNNAQVIRAEVGCLNYGAPASAGISPITGYEGGYSLDGGASWTVIPLLSGNPSLVADFDINSGIDPQTVLFGLRAINAYGAGPWAADANH